MFRPIAELSDDQILGEIEGIEKILKGLRFDVNDLVEKGPDLSFLKDLDLAMTANRAFFRRNSKGFLPEMMEHLYAERSVVKKRQLAAEQQVEDIKAILHERGEQV